MAAVGARHEVHAHGGVAEEHSATFLHFGDDAEEALRRSSRPDLTFASASSPSVIMPADRGVADHVLARLLRDEPAHLVVDAHHLVDAHPAAIAGVVALLAADRAVEREVGGVGLDMLRVRSVSASGVYCRRHA